MPDIRLTDWRFCFADGDSAEGKRAYTSVSELQKAGLKSYRAELPGNFASDLYRNGIIPDPYYGENILLLEEFENTHVWYYTVFTADGGGSPELNAGGIDTVADIYLNGSLCGRTNNMFIPHTVPLSGVKPGENELLIHIIPALKAAAELPATPSDHAMTYNYGSLRLRRAAHMYGWDILPRVMTGGIFRDISVQSREENCVEDVYFQTLRAEEGGDTDLKLFFRVRTGSGDLRNYSLKAEGSCGDSRFETTYRLWFTAGNVYVHVPAVKLWNPVGHGEQNLYNAVVTLLYRGEPVAVKETVFGIRTCELKRKPASGESDGEFCFYVNGKRIFILGSNHVPLDAMHGCDGDRLDRFFSLVKDTGINMLRSWGGGIYESDGFFSYCDRLGILVWQDFAMGCAVYPNDAAFCEKLENEARVTVRRLRQHPSLILWAGDNECDCAAEGWTGIRRNPDDNVLTRKILPEVIRQEDPTRPFLPSSPYIDSYAHNGGRLVEDHLWGPRDWFKGAYYTGATAVFASETGYHGCVAPESVGKFISGENIWPPKGAEWNLHGTSPEKAGGDFGYRTELMCSQVRTLFGKMPDNYRDFAAASQISQAEAMKFFIERFRLAKWNKTGIIWWNLLDGWPQFSDAVVDYFFTKKLAYFYIKASQQPLCLMFTEPADGAQTLCAVNDTGRQLCLEYTVTDSESGNTVLSGKTTALADSVTQVAVLDCKAINGKQGLYLIDWKAAGCSGRNHYLYGEKPFDFTAVYGRLREKGLFEAEGFSGDGNG